MCVCGGVESQSDEGSVAHSRGEGGGGAHRRYTPNATKLKKMVMPTSEAVAGAVKKCRYWI